LVRFLLFVCDKHIPNRYSNTIEQMKFLKNVLLRKHYLLLSLFFGVLLISSCRKESITAPSDFTKEKREILGDLMQVSIATETSIFPTLQQSGIHDSTYWYIQKLYDQAINSLQIDGQSPSDDRWNKTREWDITILDLDTEKTAFIIPGGHLYISTGLLKSLNKEYELYYILTFEAILMNERYLLNRMINEFNTTTLNNFVVGIPPPPGSPKMVEVATMLGDIEFDEEMTNEIDEKVVSLICKTSLFDRTGIVSIMDQLDPEHTKWLQTRKSYDYRSQIDYIVNLPVATGNDCGDVRGLGGYQRYVLDRL